MNVYLDPLHGRPSAAIFDAAAIPFKASGVSRITYVTPGSLALLCEVMSRLRGVKRPFVQFIPVSGFAGASDVAGNFARASATQLGRTLLIRMEPQPDMCQTADMAVSGSVLTAHQAAKSEVILHIVPDSIVPALYHAVISGSLGEIADRTPDWLEAAVEQHALDFRLVVVEGAAPENCPATLDLAPRCHATILLVHAGHTPSARLGSVMRQIHRAGGTLLGTVLHDAPSRPRLPGLRRSRRHHAKLSN